MPFRFSGLILGEKATSQLNLQDVGSLLRLALRQAAPKVEARFDIFGLLLCSLPMDHGHIFEAWMAELTSE